MNFSIAKIKFLLYYSSHDDKSESSFGHFKLNLIKLNWIEEDKDGF